jgi:hypothetical protein
VFFGKLYLEIDEVTDHLLAEPFDGPSQMSVVEGFAVCGVSAG